MRSLSISIALVFIVAGCRTIAQTPTPSATTAATASVPAIPSLASGSAPHASGPSAATPRETPARDDEHLVAAFVAFARAPDAAAFAALPLADEVGLALDEGQPLLVTAPRLARPDGWMIDVREFNGWAGPFSALDLLARDVATAISIGAHARCTGPVIQTPAALATLRHISVQPKDIDTCLKWWSVDLYVSPAGRVTTVSLDLGSP